MRRRHGFAQAIELVPALLLLQSRDTPGDVGAAISTEQEWDRSSLQSVVQANAKRLQEALRSLEEYGKVVQTDFARKIEKIRYESYTLERALGFSSVTTASSRSRRTISAGPAAAFSILRSLSPGANSSATRFKSVDSSAVSR